MHSRQFLALCGATLVFVLTPSGAALAARGPSVTVRIEGKTHTLLAATVVHTHTGSVTKRGAPAGACSATSAAGALDNATHHHWGGLFFSSFGDYEIKTILGERESSSSYYWAIWIDNRYATTGACGIKLHRRDRLLFAVDSVAHHEHPLGLIASGGKTVGSQLTVKVVSYSDAGVSTPLAGARVVIAGHALTTGVHGIAQFVPSHAGTLVIRATRSGYIRAAALRVRVST